jgi:recombination protein RecA
MSTIDDVVEALKRDLGERIIAKGHDIEIHSVSTGSLSVDVITGYGGFPRGYVTELFGKEGGGKTTLALTSCVRNAMDGGFSVFIDAENKTWPRRAEELGMDPDRLYVLQPNTKADTLRVLEKVFHKLANVEGGLLVMFRPYTGTLAWDVIHSLLRANLADIIVVDSVHALATGAEKDASAEDSHVGVLPRLMSQNLKSSISDVGLSDTALVFVNQIREKVGVMYGNPETTPSGWAIKFYSALRLNLRRSGNLGPRKKEYGIQVTALTEKNALSRPRRTAEFDIRWADGIPLASDVFHAAKTTNVITLHGSWYRYRGENIADSAGEKPVIAALEANPSLLGEIREAVLHPQVDPETGEIM